MHFWNSRWISSRRGRQRRPSTKSFAILTGDTLHELFGIRHLKDLTGAKLRRIKREHLSLFLPAISDDPATFTVEAERFARGGVYALDLYQRAKARQRMTRTGTGKRGQNVAWVEMNELTGVAIDRLARAWKGFRRP